jgi:hypothetical protein
MTEFLKRLLLTLGMIGAVWFVVFLIAGSGPATVAVVVVILWGLIGLFITANRRSR